jgi:2,3-bisphosphoglycerate-dependent phosphoglycerate mutase
MYGALQGVNKDEAAARYGEVLVKRWRRSYEEQPPPIDEDDERWPGHDPRYAALSEADLPKTECLADTHARLLPFWESDIAPAIRRDERVLIVAHGNSLRALVKHIDKISDGDIVEVTIPTAVPLVYELNDDLSPIRHYYLDDSPAPLRRMP